jgi:uncharacterized membrane protein
MTVYLFALALFIGVVAGLRAMTAPAVVSWAAHLGVLHLGETWLAFLGSAYAAWIFTVLALVELVTDQLPKTPSRKVPVQFVTRILSGALCGAAIGIAAGSWPIGLGLGAIGAVCGTLGGAEGRSRLARALGRDRPAALIEDFVAISAGAVILALAV